MASFPTSIQATDTPVLAVKRATKRFGSILALDEVSIEVRRGEVLALLGDNGAGKSTLLKCISGVHALDSGAILLDGKEASIGSPADARAAGIEVVYQDLALFDNLDASANFYAGRELSFPAWLPRGLRFMKQRAMRRATSELLANLKVALHSQDGAVGLMSGGQRQAVAVARAAAFAQRVMILDEPTAALGLRESRQVMNLIARLRDAGNAVILVTHNMEQVSELASRAIVMRQGRTVGEVNPSQENQQKIVSMIIGA